MIRWQEAVEPDDGWLFGGRQSELATFAEWLAKPSPPRGTLLLIDTFEELADITAYLSRELLPTLSPDVRVVVSGRKPLGTAWTDTSGRHRVRPLPLIGFSRAEAGAYLARRMWRTAASSASWSQPPAAIRTRYGVAGPPHRSDSRERRGNPSRHVTGLVLAQGDAADVHAGDDRP